MRIKCKLFLVLFFAFCAMFLPVVNAEIFTIPSAITEIEAEAFMDTSSFDTVFIPETVKTIAANAFSSDVIKVYGVSGSTAETFALETGRTFVPVNIDITDVSYPEWTSPNKIISLSIKSSTDFKPVKYRYSVTDGKNTYYFNQFSTRTTMEGSIPTGGVYDLVIEAKNAYYTEVHVIDDAITVGNHVHFSSDPITIGTNLLKEALSEDEQREVTLSSSNKRIFTVEGTTIKGVSPGKAYLKATAVQPEGTVVTSVLVNVYQAPVSVLFENAPAELFEGSTAHISSKFSPDNAIAEEFIWLSENPEIASITIDGVVTAHHQGETNIIARVDGVDFVHPLRVTVPVNYVWPSIQKNKPIYTKGTAQIETFVLPANADNQTFVYTSMNPDIAVVDENGVITGVTAGKAEILITAKDGGGACDILDVTVIRGVDTVSVSADKTHLYPTQTLKTEFTVIPDNANGKTLIWTSSDPSIATVDENGIVIAHNPGYALITVEAENGVSASLNIYVYSFDTEAGFILSESQLYLTPGDTHALTYKIYPEGVEVSPTWTSSNPQIASVSEDGIVTGVSPGTAWINIVSSEDPNMISSCKITVLNTKKTLIMPKRKTTISEINVNLQRIDAVKASAFSELDALYRSGLISESVLNSRKQVISNAFDMYSFPWMTLEPQVYWNVDNSEGGVKDFQPGIVYYGLPYISGTYYSQRLYNTEKAISENRYYLSDSGTYYILNQDNLIKDKYCGNDCSALTAISYFGFPADIGTWKTNVFAVSSKFKTLASPLDMYPGDIIVRGYKHVVIFLYYANPAKTQVVVLEQGGSEAGINTVSTGIYDMDHYFKNGYIPRRLAGWT